MKQNSTRKGELGRRAEVLKDAINSARKLPTTQLCAAFSINPIETQIHGNVLIWQKGETEIQEFKISQTSLWTKKVLLKVISNSGGNMEQDFDLHKFFKLLKIDTKSVKNLMAVPFFTGRDKKPLALLFVGYDQKPGGKRTIENKVRKLVKNHEYLLENAWLLGKYKVIVDIGNKINETLESYQEMFNELFEKVSSVLDTSYYFLLAVYNPQANNFDKYEYYKYSTRSDKKQCRKRQDFEGALKLALGKKTVIFISNFEEEIRQHSELKEITFLPDNQPNPKSMIFVPLLLREELLGVLSIQHEEAHAFDLDDVRIMELLGNQVSLALNSIRLYNHLEGINSASAQLISPLSQERNLSSKEKGFLSRIVKTIKESTRADNIILFPYSAPPMSVDITSGFEKVRVAGSLMKRKKEELVVRTSDDIVCLVLRKFQQDKNYMGEFEDNSQLLYSKLKGVSNRRGTFETDEKISSSAALPLKIDDDFVGVLFVNFRKPQKFTALQKLHIITLAKFAALSIRIQKDFLFSKQKYLNALQEIDSLIGEDLSVKDVMQKILDIAVKISKAVDSAIYLYDPEVNKLYPSAANGPHMESYEDVFIDVDKKKGLVTKAFLTGRSQLDNDVRENPDYFEIIEDTRSELDVPLIDFQSKKAIGVINLESTATSAFQEEDKLFLASIASQAALAIKVARAKKSALELSLQIKTTKDVVFNIIKQKSDPQREIQKVLNYARKLTGAEIAILQLYQEGKPTAVFKSVTTDKSKPLRDLKKIEPHREKLGIINWVAERKRVYRTNNTDNSKIYKGSSLIKSELAVPLKSKGEVYAVLDVESHRYDAFDARHINLLSEFAVTAVLVAQTASRALKAEQEIEKEIRRFQILNQAMQDFSRVDYFVPEMFRTTLDEKLYQIVLDSLIEFRNEGEMLIRRINREKTSFELVKLHNKYQEVVPQSVPFMKNDKLASLNAQAAQSGEYIYLPDLDNRPTGVVKPFLDKRIKCIIVVPIKSPSNYYGNVVWSHTQKYFFDDSDILLIKGLAAQLGGALALLESAKTSEELETMSLVAEFVSKILHTLAGSTGAIQVNLLMIESIMQKQSKLPWGFKKYKSDIEDALKDIKEMVAGLKDKLLSSNKKVAFHEVKPLTSNLENLIPSEDDELLQTNYENIKGWVRVDINEIIEIVRHLLINSIRAVKEGGGQTTLSVFKSLNELIIKVSDTGPGISKEWVSKIFDLGFSTTGSTGLGLWTSLRMARRNICTLEFVEENRPGATFRLRIPLYDKPNELNNE